MLTFQIVNGINTTPQLTVSDEMCGLMKEFCAGHGAFNSLSAGSETSHKIETVEEGDINLFGNDSNSYKAMVDYPTQSEGVVDYMPPVARWFLFLATAYGLCEIQDSHTGILDLRAISLDRLLELYKPTEDWQRERIEQQHQYFIRNAFQNYEFAIAANFF